MHGPTTKEEPGRLSKEGPEAGTSPVAYPVAFACPILPGREEHWRRFVQELEGTRSGGCEEMLGRLGVHRATVWLAPDVRRETAIIYLEAEEPQEVVRRLALSEEPFDVWFRERLFELHGVDLRGLHPGLTPELVFRQHGPGA